MTSKIQISGKGIKSILKKYNYCEALAEFIWNGFDALATSVEVQYEEANTLGALSEIRVVDNGYGIPQEHLKQKFSPFFESEKRRENSDNRNHSLSHGRNGVGRLTFFTFATNAVWSTKFKRGKEVMEYEITITSKNLEDYTGDNSELKKSQGNQTGTTVIFTGISELTKTHLEEEVVDFLKDEFGWFLELNKDRGFSIKVAGVDLNYETIIGDRETTVFKNEKTNREYEIRYVRWNQNLQKEYSRYYFIDSKNEEKWKETTKLNNQGDSFYHSVFIKNNYFDDFLFEAQKEQKALMGGTRADDEYKYLEKELENYLRRKRKPFIKEFANQLITQYEKDGVMPKFSEEVWDNLKKTELHDVIKGLYEVQPKIFNKLNQEQKKIFIGFLNLILDTDERNKIFEIIKEIVELDSEERDELLDLLKTTRLSCIIKTIKLIENRYRIISSLADLVSNETLGANEIVHVQQFIESHYWIFGEQYNLVTAAEPKFEEALRKYIHLIRGVDEKVSLEHPDKKKEMDIFLCRQRLIDGEEMIENLVIELKHPKKSLGKEELDQVETYLRTIKNIDLFNNPNSNWTFVLVGNRLKKGQSESKPYIESKIESYKHLGKPCLALYDPDLKYEVYVKTWSQIFADFELKHKFINEKLSLEREKLVSTAKSADQVLAGAKHIASKL